MVSNVQLGTVNWCAEIRNSNKQKS